MINIIIGFTSEVNALNKTFEYLKKNNFINDEFFKIIIMSKGICKFNDKFLRKYKLKKNSILIPNQSGIYPSLNYCSSKIKNNEYIWFLGAGDLPIINSKIIKEKILNTEIKWKSQDRVFIGHCFDVNVSLFNGDFLYRHFQKLKLPYSLILNTYHHQGLIVKNSYFKKYKYPTNTKIYSDYSILLNSYRKKLYFEFYSIPIVQFHLGGESSKSKYIYWKEASILRFKYLNFFQAGLFSFLHLIINCILRIKNFKK